MVEIRPVTEERVKEKERMRLEKQLAEECFPKCHVDSMGNLFFIRTNVICNYVADKNVGTIVMRLYKRKFESQAQEFARRYEEQFGLKEHSTDFIIETDYSK